MAKIDAGLIDFLELQKQITLHGVGFISVRRAKSGDLVFDIIPSDGVTVSDEAQLGLNDMPGDVFYGASTVETIKADAR